MIEVAAPPTTEERYVRATHSSHLELKQHERCDLDILIAAGWVKETMGTKLYRLAAEFDSVRAEVHRGPTLNLTEFALVLCKLKSLPEVKDALGRMACIQATKQRFMEPDDKVRALTGHILAAWLDPNCAKCEGRGHNGGYGTPQILCRACGATGKRRSALGHTDEQRRFAGFLLGRMDRLMDAAGQQLKRYLRTPR